MNTRFSIQKGDDGRVQLTVSYQLSGPLSFMLDADGASRNVSTGLFIDQERKLTMPVAALLEKTAHFDVAQQVEEGHFEIRPLHPGQVALLDRMIEADMGNS